MPTVVVGWSPYGLFLGVQVRPWPSSAPRMIAARWIPANAPALTSLTTRTTCGRSARRPSNASPRPASEGQPLRGPWGWARRWPWGWAPAQGWAWGWTPARAMGEAWVGHQHHQDLGTGEEMGMGTGMGLGTGMGMGRRTGTGTRMGMGMGLGIGIIQGMGLGTGTIPRMGMGTRKNPGTSLGTSTRDWHMDKHRHCGHHVPRGLLGWLQGQPPAPAPIRVSLPTAPSRQSWARSLQRGRRSARRGARRPSGSAWSRPPSSYGSSALPSCPPASLASSRSIPARPLPVPSPSWPRSSRTWPTSPRKSGQGTAPALVGRDMPMGKPWGSGDIPYMLCGTCFGQSWGSRVVPNVPWGGRVVLNMPRSSRDVP